MTIKLKDLTDFVAHLHRLGYVSQISDNILKREIGVCFGISDYIQKNIITKLVEFGFIKISSVSGVWDFCEKESGGKQ